MKIFVTKYFKTQNKTLKFGNIFQNISSAYTEDKNTYIFNEQSKNYQDDTKENLNPETISCKNITDDLLMNTELNINDSNVFINNNENEKITQSNLFKIIENNNEGLNNENINLIDNIENNFDTTINYNDNYNKEMNDIKQNIPNLNFDNITDNSREIHNIIEKDLKNNSYNSTKLIQHVLFLENHANKSGNMNKKEFKVSIDLKKIKNFVDNNPDLFSRYKKEDNEWCIEQTFLKETNNIRKKFNLSEHIKNFQT